DSCYTHWIWPVSILELTLADSIEECLEAAAWGFLLAPEVFLDDIINLLTHVDIRKKSIGCVISKRHRTSHLRRQCLAPWCRCPITLLSPRYIRHYSIIIFLKLRRGVFCWGQTPESRGLHGPTRKA